MTTELAIPAVYKAIVAVQGAMASVGIAKTQKNTQQNYHFRGIDDVYRAFAPFLKENSLCILPRVIERNVTERTTKSGGVLFYVTLDIEYDLVCSTDGSKHTVSVYGEAMDSGDKATNKAMSAAYKTLCFQMFCVPTEGDNDTENNSPEVEPRAKPAPAQPKASPPPQSRPQAAPDGVEVKPFQHFALGSAIGFGKKCPEKLWHSEDRSERVDSNYLTWMMNNVRDRDTNQPKPEAEMAAFVLQYREQLDLAPVEGDPGMPLGGGPPEFNDDDIPF